MNLEGGRIGHGKYAIAGNFKTHPSQHAIRGPYINKGVITIGEPLALGELCICVEELDTNIAVIAYSDNQDADRGDRNVVIATADGIDVSFGTPVTILTNALSTKTIYWVVKLSTTKFMVVFQSATVSNSVRGVVCTVSGTTITKAGTDYEIYNFGGGNVMESAPYEMRACYLEDDKCVVVTYDRTWSSAGGSQHRNLYGIVCSISGTVITPTSEQTAGDSQYYLLDGTNYTFDACSLGVNSFVTMGKEVYDPVSGLDPIEVFVNTVSGITISWGTAPNQTEINTTTKVGFRMAKVSDTQIAIRYVISTGGSNYNNTTRVGSISGDTITWGDTVAIPYVYSTGFSLGDLARFNDSAFAHIYLDTDYFGQARGYKITGNEISQLDEVQYDEDVQSSLANAFPFADNVANNKIMFGHTEGTFPNTILYIRAMELG